MYHETKLSKQQKEILLSMRGLRDDTDSLAWRIAKSKSKLEHAEILNIWPPRVTETYTHYRAFLIDRNGDGSNLILKKVFLFPTFKASFSRSIKRLVDRGILEKERYQRKVTLTYKGQRVIEEIK